MYEYSKDLIANRLNDVAKRSFLSISNIWRSIHNIGLFEMIKLEQNDLPAIKNDQKQRKTVELPTPELLTPSTPKLNILPEDEYYV